MTSLESSTRDFYELILTLDPADLDRRDRECLRIILQDLLILAEKSSIHSQESRDLD
jgi:hypothetical protein